jgi:hypothetical protein
MTTAIKEDERFVSCAQLAILDFDYVELAPFFQISANND